jgi:hypothetical protein
VGAVDPLGLAECTYAISSHKLSCTSNTAKDPNFVGPPEVKTIDPSAVHSGREEHKNNPASTNVGKYGPIWPGKFNMTQNDNHPGWWALQETDWTPVVSSIEYYIGMRRAGANLHTGTVSWGCIKVNPSHQKQFNDLTGLLKKENGKNVLTVTP